MLTENANLILPTIISRCQEFELQALGFDELSEKLQQAGISKDKASLLLGLTDSLEIAIELSKDDEFATMTADVWEWFKLIMTNDLRAFVNVTTHLKQYFSDRSRQDMLLDLIVLLVRDVMLLKFEERLRASRKRWSESLSKMQSLRLKTAICVRDFKNLKKETTGKRARRRKTVCPNRDKILKNFMKKVFTSATWTICTDRDASMMNRAFFAKT